jgi:hypothetical protein
MVVNSNNPLQKHFRQPAIYLRLPGGGRFWNQKSLDLPESGEIPIYPMTIKDEITIKTPDALMNGQGIVDVIQSCCPCITNAWDTPSVDLDAIFISIRIASYGSNMDINSVCPQCGEENKHTVELIELLDNVRAPAYDPVEIDDLAFEFKPQTFKNYNDANLISYEQQKLILAINDSELSDEQKVEKFNTIFPKLTDMNVSNIVNNIQSITANGVAVTDKNHIKEFIMNCDRKVFAKIKETVDQYANEVKIKPLNSQCAACEKTYAQELTFDQANFFV